nr:hypothetical protein [Pseudonocardia ammonioxydans]
MNTLDLAAQVADQPQLGVHPGPTRRLELDASKQFGAGDPEQITDRHLDAGAGEHRVHLVLQVRAQRDQLGPMPHQLGQLSGGRRRDPCLRQATHPQQIGQIRGVAFVVLDPRRRTP